MTAERIEPSFHNIIILCIQQGICINILIWHNNIGFENSGIWFAKGEIIAEVVEWEAVENVVAESCLRNSSPR